jgi:hypothetical protein
VLFLGNSTFKANGGSLEPFEEFCKAAGVRVEAVTQSQRIDPFIVKQANDPKVVKFIQNGEFSHVILLTRASDFLNDRDKRAAFRGFRKLHETIVTSGGRTVIYMAYVVQGQYDSFPRIRRGHRELKEVLDAQLINNTKHAVTLVPVGAMWMAGKGQFGEKAWYSDPVHGTPLAQFANGCLWYTYLTGNDPRKNAFRGDLPAEQSDWIKEKVWEYYIRGENG